ncbi:MAG: hypothetical protein ACP5DX_07875 [Paracoccaceae bacterium]
MTLPANQRGLAILSHDLENLALETNWLIFAGKLRAAMSDHKALGFGSPSDVLQRVAALRGKDPASLRNPLAAESWVARHAPEIHAEKPDRLAMTSVLLLSQINDISPETGAEIAPRVFQGSISRGELKSVLEKTKQEKAVPGAVGHARWHRARAFENLVENFVSEHMELVGNWRKPSVDAETRGDVVPCDLVITSDGEPVAAVEIKSSRQKKTRRVQVEALAVASLLHRDFPEVFLIMSSDWEKAVPEMVQLRASLALEGIKLATLDEEMANKDPDQAFRLW